jgi:hypothetical protein
MTNFKEFLRRAQSAQKAVDEIMGGKLHRIEIQLTDNEYNAMTLMCAFATEAAFRKGDQRLANMFLTVTNRLHENDPNFIPYDATSIAKIAVTQTHPQDG